MKKKIIALLFLLSTIIFCSICFASEPKMIRNNDERLLVAAKEGNLELVKQLFRQGARVESIYTNPGIFSRDVEKTALMEASHHGHLSIVQFLISKGADVNALNEKRMTPLLFAAIYGHLEIVRLLVESGADIDVDLKRNRSPLHAAIGQRKGDIVSYLIKAGANTDPQNHNGLTILMMHTNCGNIDETKRLLVKGADIDAKDYRGLSAFDRAIGSRSPEIVSICLQFNPDPSLLKNYLESAAYYGNIDVFKLIWNHYDNSEAIFGDGLECLNEARKRKKVKMIQYLISISADLML